MILLTLDLRQIHVDYARALLKKIIIKITSKLFADFTRRFFLRSMFQNLSCTNKLHDTVLKAVLL